MLLRATIVMLVMLNLGAALWWASGPHAPPARAQAATSQAPTLRLLHEAVPTPAQAPASPVAPVVEGEDALAAAEDAVAPPSAPVAAPVCRSFGPFADADAAERARAALAAAGVQATPREVAARAVRGWKVAMPPFASREDAVAMAERLRAAGVSDLYVMGEGPEANGIALGRYGSEDAARRRQADLGSKGFQAQAEPLGGPAQAWLDARLPPTVDAPALARIAGSRALDCARLR